MSVTQQQFNLLGRTALLEDDKVEIVGIWVEGMHSVPKVIIRSLEEPVRGALMIVLATELDRVGDHG